MNRLCRGRPAALALACAALLCAGRAGAGDCAHAADELAAAAREAGVRRVSVLEFSAKGGAGKSEAEYVSEQVAARLAGAGRPELVERSGLAAVLREARLFPSAGDGTIPDGVFSVDAVVTGAVFAADGGLKIVMRLVDVKTGKVLAAAQASGESRWPALPPEAVEGESWDLPLAPRPQGLRDAVADLPPSCEGVSARLAGLNSGLIDAKARYWAAKMKEPGFSVRLLTRNPGTEIADPAARAKFYGLLGLYHQSDKVPELEAGERARLEDLLAAERLHYDECGYR